MNEDNDRVVLLLTDNSSSSTLSVDYPVPPVSSSPPPCYSTGEDTLPEGYGNDSCPVYSSNVIKSTSDLSIIEKTISEEASISELVKPLPGILQKSGPLPPPPNYLLLAIVATVCCFMPTGIIAVLKTAEASKLYNSGQQREAKVCADKAGFWIRVSFYIGMAMALIAGILAFMILGSRFLTLP